MQEIALSLAGLGLLYLTRRKVTSELARLVTLLGGGQRAFTVLWSLIFLPGTIIHEVSHFFAAALTGTRIGKVEIFPSLPSRAIGSEEQPKIIHLGYVQTQELGLIRGFLVGSAPFLVGLGLLVWLSASLSSQFSVNGLRVADYELLDLLKVYLFFTVANSLFLSWSDIKHTLPLVVITVLGVTFLYLVGVRLTIAPDTRLVTLGSSLQRALVISVGINLIASGTLWGINVLLRTTKP